MFQAPNATLFESKNDENTSVSEDEDAKVFVWVLKIHAFINYGLRHSCSSKLVALLFSIFLLSTKV